MSQGVINEAETGMKCNLCYNNNEKNANERNVATHMGALVNISNLSHLVFACILGWVKKTFVFKKILSKYELNILYKKVLRYSVF